MRSPFYSLKLPSFAFSVPLERPLHFHALPEYSQIASTWAQDIRMAAVPVTRTLVVQPVASHFTD
jgi:hypothetical protein